MSAAMITAAVAFDVCGLLLETTMPAPYGVIEVTLWITLSFVAYDGFRRFYLYSVREKLLELAGFPSDQNNHGPQLIAFNARVYGQLRTLVSEQDYDHVVQWAETDGFGKLAHISYLDFVLDQNEKSLRVHWEQAIANLVIDYRQRTKK